MKQKILKTNQHVRKIMQKSDLPNVELANKYSINVQTVSKWKGRDFTEDKSSRPNTIHYALSDLDKELIRVARTLTRMELDDLVDCVSQNIPKAKRSNVYRTIRAFGISQVPQEQKEKAKTFKEY
ncbi:MAG: integrase, partial [Sulfurovum sp. PC08-66]